MSMVIVILWTYTLDDGKVKADWCIIMTEVAVIQCTVRL